jgi:hypothetical protein
MKLAYFYKKNLYKHDFRKKKKTTFRTFCSFHKEESCKQLSISGKEIHSLGFMVRGSPNSSVKKLCVGILHMLTHIPTHPLFSKYLQGFIQSFLTFPTILPHSIYRQL